MAPDVLLQILQSLQVNLFCVINAFDESHDIAILRGENLDVSIVCCCKGQRSEMMTVLPFFFVYSVFTKEIFPSESVITLLECRAKVKAPSKASRNAAGILA